MRTSRVAIIGARGLGRHGGFETVVSELAPRLSERGYVVYCSTRRCDSDAVAASTCGVRLLRFPLSFPRTYGVGKAFEVLYDSYFVMKCRFSVKADVVYCLGVACGLSLLVMRLFGLRSAVNVDGLEWTRDKFGIVERFFLRMSFLACCVASSRIVLDNRALMAHVPRKFRWKAVHITYGVSRTDCASLPRCESSDRTTGLDSISERGYWLVVARLEPENNIHRIIGGYLSCRSMRPLLIIGDCSSSRYEELLHGLASKASHGKKVIMAGSIYDKGLLTRLRCGCLAYIHGHSVGGTNPSLLEAMSASNVVVAHDNPFNRDVCAQTALYFSDESSLAETMSRIDADPSAFRDLGETAEQRTSKMHRWDDIVSEHERLFSDIGS